MKGDLYILKDTYWICDSEGTIYSTFINFKLRDYTYSFSHNFTDDNKIEFNQENIKNIFKKILPNMTFDERFVIKNWKDLYDIYINYTFM